MIAAVLAIAGIIAVGCLGYQLFRRSLGTMQSREDSLVQAAERQEEEEAALSEAINRILGNEYQLFHGDDELYDHLVVMRLKSTQKF